MAEQSNWRRIKRAFTFARPHRLYLLFVVMLTLMTAAMTSVEPMIMKMIVDGLTASDMSSLLWGVIILISLGLVKELATMGSNFLSWRTRLDIHYSLLDAAVERIHRMPAHYHRNEGVGAIMNRLDRSIQGLINAVSEISFNVLPAVAYLTMAIFLMIRMDWRLTLVVAAFTPLPAIIASFAAPNQISRERKLFDNWAKIYSRFNEVLSGIVTVRSFAMENAEKSRFLKDVYNTNQIVVKGIGFDSGVGALQNLIILLARVAAVGFGGYLVIKGDITVGTLVAFMGYVGGLFGPVQGLTGIYRILRTASVSLDQVFSFLDAPTHIKDAPDAVEVNKLNGFVRFEDVSFSYKSSSDAKPLLESISFESKPGEMTAIVGPSGAGKTTLMAMLQRFYDPVKGRVTIDGVDLKSMKQDELRRHIGVVLQDALLFNETIRDNIAYGRPDATLLEIQEAAKAANAHDFILRMENGYDTYAGEGGKRLSAGERQRIAIARAILKDPPILIFDEATSALDAESEALVQEAVETLIRNRTTFFIAHRLSTVVNADRIMVLRNGNIVESGSHKDLLDKKGYYSSLVNRQTRGLLDISAHKEKSQGQRAA